MEFCFRVFQIGIVINIDIYDTFALGTTISFDSWTSKWINLVIYIYKISSRSCRRRNLTPLNVPHWARGHCGAGAPALVCHMDLYYT